MANKELETKIKDRLKKLSKDTICKFKVGDKVKVNTKGKLGVIFDILYYEDYWVYKISYFNGQTDYVYEKDLEPYTEPRWTFTDDEKVILRNLPEEYKWIARDKNGTIIVCISKPHKIDGWECIGMDFELLIPFNYLFQSIKWEDTEACEFRKYL